MLQGEGTSEFVIEAHDVEELRSWLNELAVNISHPSITEENGDMDGAM